jgi:uncharacterized membrane protein
MITKEHKRRSIAKCFTWRTTAFVDTVILSLIFTGSISRAFTIGGIEIITKTFLYYFHERAWVFICRRVDARQPETVDSCAEKPWLSLSKTLSWRVVGSVDTFIIALVITGNLTASAGIGIAELFTKVVLYYIHERAWIRITWGKSPALPGQQTKKVGGVPVRDSTPSFG